MGHPRRVVSLLLVLALLMAASPGAGPRARAADGGTRRSRRLAPGIKLIALRRHRPPNRIRVIKVNLAKPATVDVALPDDTLTGTVKTSAIASAHGAIAAVNGTYNLPSGRPVGVFAEDGDLKTSPLNWGRAFSLTADESRFFLGHPRLSMWARERGSSEIWRISKWNEPGRVGDALAASTPAGGWLYRPPGRSCSVRLRRPLEPRWAPTVAGVRRGWIVRKTLCAKESLRRAGGVVVSAKRGSRRAPAIRALDAAQQIVLGWSVGWPGALDVMGGNPVLLRRGRVVAPATCASYFCGRNPRTGVGMTPRGRMLLVTVDGRQDRRSVGMNLAQFARLFRRLGATRAINIDGGGSTTMVVRGRVINRPSDASGERPVGSALLVRTRPDPDEPRPIGDGDPASLSQAAPLRPSAGSSAALVDPGSTGGMLDAAARGYLGGPARLPRVLEHVVRRYRAADRPARR
jgi:hypothetical protein